VLFFRRLRAAQGNGGVFAWTVTGGTGINGLKSARIVDFCGKLSRFMDFENTVDCGSAVSFGADSGLCLS